MKTIDKIFIICMGALLMGCGETKEPIPDVPDEVKPEPETHKLTFVLPEDGEKTAWVEGDAIVVHGEYAKDQVTVTLKAADISSDKKSASCEVSGLYPYVNQECRSTLYAAWPAEAVDNLAHCFYYSKFSATDRQIMAAYNDKDYKFQFQNLCGSLSFTSGGDYESFTLVGNKKETLGFDFMQVMLTDAEQLYKQYTGNPVVTLDCKASAVTTIYFPDGTEIPSGVFIKFRDKKGNFVKSYQTFTPITIERAKNVALGDISQEIVTYDDPFSSDIQDIDKNGNANCYILTQPGKYKFKAVRGNDYTRYLEGAAKAEILWETWNDLSDPDQIKGTVVSSASYAEDYVIIHMPDPIKPGNAVVAVRDMENNILWSWHIWVPKTPIVTDSYDNVMGAPSMDRHLGALVATTDSPSEAVDPLSFGLFYQWGRKDPFPGQVKNGPANVAGTQMTRQNGPITIAESIANPTLYTYDKKGDEGYEWCKESIPDAWGADADKSIYDPCPPGYRVPLGSGAVWVKNFSAWTVDAVNGWFKMGGLVFPFCGYMDDNEGSYCKTGERSVMWSAGASSATDGKAMYIRTTTYSSTNARAARGASVRCVTQ